MSQEIQGTSSYWKGKGTGSPQEPPEGSQVLTPVVFTQGEVFGLLT